jgi:DNA invertase Pin-like site-specific DNA recombinase
MAACALIISAGAQNVAHGYALGLASSEFRAIVLALASAGSSLLGPFCWLAVFRGRGFGTRCAALVLALGCLAYAAACSLGFVAGSRDTAIAGQQAAVDAYQDRRAIAAAARAELGSLKGQTRAAIERRRELAKILATSGAAPSAPAAKPDSQAAAVAFYLNAAGWSVTTAAVGTWLNLGTVLFLELAAALGLTVASGLYPSTRQNAPGAPPAPEILGHPIVPARPARPASDAPARRDDDDKADPPPPPRPRGKPGRPASVLAADAIERLRKAGGRANGVRGVAKVLGTSKSTAHRILHQLAAAGQITMSSGRHGVSVALA